MAADRFYTMDENGVPLRTSSPTTASMWVYRELWVVDTETNTLLIKGQDPQPIARE